VSHLASRFRRHELEVAQAQLLARVLRDADVPAERPGRATAAGDSAKLRGAPFVGRGISGAIRGTVPHVDGIR
jgi:hypothetical protein